MTYRLILLSPENEDFECVFDINAEDTLESLHFAIVELLEYPKDLFTSFMYSDSCYNVQEEITLEDARERNIAIASAFEDEDKDLLYVFDTLLERCFYVKVVEKSTASLDKYKLVRKKGVAPSPQLSNEEMEAFLLEEDAAFGEDEDRFFSEDDFDEDMEFSSFEEEDYNY